MRPSLLLTGTIFALTALLPAGSEAAGKRSTDRDETRAAEARTYVPAPPTPTGSNLYPGNNAPGNGKGKEFRKH